MDKPNWRRDAHLSIGSDTSLEELKRELKSECLNPRCSHDWIRGNFTSQSNQKLVFYFRKWNSLFIWNYFAGNETLFCRNTPLNYLGIEWENGRKRWRVFTAQTLNRKWQTSHDCTHSYQLKSDANLRSNSFIRNFSFPFDACIGLANSDRDQFIPLRK